jgi:hypothetical protein
VTAQAFDQVLAGDPSQLGRESSRLGGTALVMVLAILFVVAAAVLATVEWIAPASAGAVPG